MIRTTACGESHSEKVIRVTVTIMSPTTATYAPDLAERLRMLFLERAAAERAGLGANRLYMDDLEQEIRGCRGAYVGAAVTEIAVLRGQLGGRLSG